MFTLCMLTMYVGLYDACSLFLYCYGFVLFCFVVGIT